MLTHCPRSLNSTSDLQLIMRETTTEAQRALCYREPIPEGSIKSALRYPTYVLVCRSMGISGMDRYSCTRPSNLYSVRSAQIPSGKTGFDDNLRCRFMTFGRSLLHLATGVFLGCLSDREFAAASYARIGREACSN